MASAVIIAGFYGTDQLSFTVGSDSRPGVFRSYASVSACADEIGLSRIYGGIHFPSANRDGKFSGARIGDFVSENFLLPNSALPMVRLEEASYGGCRLRVHGHIGSNCVVEATSDLVTWLAVATNRAVVGGFDLCELPSVASYRFFRVRQE